MKKIDPVVLKETKYIALWTLILSVLMQSVFLIIGKWDFTVLSGNMLGAAATVANFFALALGVIKAMENDGQDSKRSLKLSGSMRFAALFVIVLAGVMLDRFNPWAVILPLFFPRIAIAIRPLLNKKERGLGG